jgi:hypothetical protein
VKATETTTRKETADDSSLEVAAVALGVHARWAVPLGVTAVSAQPNTLKAKKTEAAPALDGSMDAAWKASPAMTVKGVGG